MSLVNTTYDSLPDHLKKIISSNPHLHPQPSPVRHGGVNVWFELLRDMVARDEFCSHKYSGHLEPHDGRNSLADLYQELLDALVYTKKLLIEGDLLQNQSLAFGILLRILQDSESAGRWIISPAIASEIQALYGRNPTTAPPISTDSLAIPQPAKEHSIREYAFEVVDAMFNFSHRAVVNGSPESINRARLALVKMVVDAIAGYSDQILASYQKRESELREEILLLRQQPDKDSVPSSSPPTPAPPPTFKKDVRVLLKRCGCYHLIIPPWYENQKPPFGYRLKQYQIGSSGDFASIDDMVAKLPSSCPTCRSQADDDKCLCGGGGCNRCEPQGRG